MSDGFYSNNCQHGVLVLDCYYCSGGPTQVPPIVVSNDSLVRVLDAAIAERDALRAELSALRAAQPLTKEKIDAVIQRVRLEGDLSMTVPIEVAEAIARFVFKLRDALLDSLADPK